METNRINRPKVIGPWGLAGKHVDSMASNKTRQTNGQTNKRACLLTTILDVDVNMIVIPVKDYMVRTDKLDLDTYSIK